MKIYTSSYQGNTQLFSLQDQGDYKLRIIGENMWSDLFSSTTANNVTWHINQKRYKSLVKLYHKLYRLYDNNQHELWVYNNSPFRYKSNYAYKYLNVDTNKLIIKLERVINKIKKLGDI